MSDFQYFGQQLIHGTSGRRRIELDEEFERLSARLESLDTLEESRELHAEERELQSLLALLCTEYEDRTVTPPSSTPLEVLRFLMDHNDLISADMLNVFGSRAVASQVMSGKREIGKAHARRLAERFHISVEAFI